MPWRVVTRRVISRPSSQGMRDQFSQAGLEPVIFSRNEAVELHAFDDPQTFTTMGEAAQVRNEWLRLKVKADIIKKDGRFHVALGRFIMTAHAAQMQAHLKKTGRPFSYEKRRIVIPVHRFTFPSLPQNQAQHLWEKVKELGFADPVLMSEKQFADIYELTESGHPAK